MTAGRTGGHSGPPGRCVGDLCIRQSFRPDGSWKIVEPMAGDKLEDNFESGRAAVLRGLYAASKMVCVSTFAVARSRHGAWCL